MYQVIRILLLLQKKVKCDSSKVDKGYGNSWVSHIFFYGFGSDGNLLNGLVETRRQKMAGFCYMEISEVVKQEFTRKRSERWMN